LPSAVLKAAGLSAGKLAGSFTSTAAPRFIFDVLGGGASAFFSCEARTRLTPPPSARYEDPAPNATTTARSTSAAHSGRQPLHNTVSLFITHLRSDRALESIGETHPL
jgi:hypothetical protein